ncbi:hypothetical protein [Bradyrhizobium sp. LHD-71]|uniref:hypothetical protein n=1 Tax=Bradyrhizobium sp. LHD-71 TaxID=3072141 RepID=UPI00280D2D58|nr:hypothetical protein [Bradyrhizobium sp. LHD-71]MDQ8727716.1 hypothetical protein [Bradyrhizobium sp. LHD-71]
MQPLPSPDQLGSARVLVRFMLRLGMILLCGTLARTSYAYAVAVLLTLSILLCFFWGTVRRERMLGRSLTNWDEAMAYGCLASLALKFT